MDKVQKDYVSNIVLYMLPNCKYFILVSIVLQNEG
jgi:hypothetical protein